MRIASFMLVCFVAFALIIGCSSEKKAVENTEAPATTEAAKPTPPAATATPVAETEEITLNVTGMT
jgi:hypothetical protein